MVCTASVNSTLRQLNLGGWGELFELAAELLLRAHLELPRALAADAELAAEGRERGGIFAQNPLLDDEPLSLVEHRKRIGETLLAHRAHPEGSIARY